MGISWLKNTRSFFLQR